MEHLLTVVQCAKGTKHLQEWQPKVDSFRQDQEFSIATKAFHLEPWIFQSLDIVRTFSYMSWLDEEWKKNAVIHNLTSVHNVVELYVNVAPKMFITACATIIGVMILFGTLLVLSNNRFRVRSAMEQASAAPS